MKSMYQLNKNALKRIITNSVKYVSSSAVAHNYSYIRKSALNSPRINVLYENKFIFIKELNGDSLKFPSIWLRDNCQCSDCFHVESKSRIIDWTKFNGNVVPKHILFREKTLELEIIWSDKHKSSHNLQWLKERSFDQTKQKEYLRKWYRPHKNLWGKSRFQDILESYQFGDIINNDEALKSWLTSLATNGVVMIKNASLTEQECRKLANRIRFIRKTHYGEEFIVQAKEGTSNVAYLSTPLQLHTDLPYYEYKPGVNLLHCIVQSSSDGAVNLLTDGFWVAEKMRINYKNYFQILSETLVNWSDVGKEDENKFHSIYRAPVICLDREKKLKRINHSIPQRDSHFSIHIDQVDEWYQAMVKFVELIHEDAVSFKTQPGDILTFDNIRLIHGRSGYTDINGNTRHLVGAYLDWDEIYSRLRTLS